MNASETNYRTGALVVGFGSPHGDDQAGWRVIRQLEPLLLPDVELRQATVPHDLVDWLGAQTSLHLIDACVTDGNASDGNVQNYQRYELADEGNGHESSLRIVDSSQRPSAKAVLDLPIQLRSGGSHQIDVFTVLELAACLRRLPKHVVLWAIPGQRFRPGLVISDRCENAIANCVEQLTKELGHA